MKVINITSRSSVALAANMVAEAVSEDGRVQLEARGAGAVYPLVEALLAAQASLGDRNLSLSCDPVPIEEADNMDQPADVRLIITGSVHGRRNAFSGDQFIDQIDQEVADDFAERQDFSSSGTNELVEKLAQHNAESPILSGGDVDAAWDQAGVGEETVGGMAPTPDQDIVEQLGEAVGLTYEDDEPLHTAEKLEERDQHRWELDPASAAESREQS
jgi:stage V sporulation protein SpoVS